jgi:hypothetical protein
MQADHWGSVAGAPFRPSGTMRRYYIQAEEVMWDYAPHRSDLVHGTPFGPEQNTYVKVRSARRAHTACVVLRRHLYVCSRQGMPVHVHYQIWWSRHARARTPLSLQYDSPRLPRVCAHSWSRYAASACASGCIETAHTQ